MTTGWIDQIDTQAGALNVMPTGDYDTTRTDLAMEAKLSTVFCLAVVFFVFRVTGTRPATFLTFYGVSLYAALHLFVFHFYWYMGFVATVQNVARCLFWASMMLVGHVYFKTERKKQQQQDTADTLPLHPSYRCARSRGHRGHAFLRLVGLLTDRFP